MKTIISVLSTWLLVSWFASASCSNVSNDKINGQSVNIVCSQELHELTNALVSEYGKLNPSVKINLSVQSVQKMSEVQSLSFIGELNLYETNGEKLWKIVVARDAVIPVMNAGNPMIEKISQKGITPAEFSEILSFPDKQKWETALNGDMKERIHIYITDNEQIKARIGAFTNINPAILNDAALVSGEEIINKIKDDVLSMGFCSLRNLFDPVTKEFHEKIRVIPIDKNLNGRIDYFEDIYAGKDDFLRGIWIGKYPKTLCGNIFAIAPEKPADKNELDFLHWVIDEGQSLLASSGYSELTGFQKQSDMEAMISPVVPSDISTPPASASNWWILVFFTLVIAALMGIPVFIIRRRKPDTLKQDVFLVQGLNENSLKAPAGLFFGKTHTWAYMEKDGIVRVGMDDFLQHVTGPVTRIVMKVPGEKVRKGEELLTIVQEGKQLHLYAPVSGVIRENNPQLQSNSRLVNTSPYSDGWIYLIEPGNWLKEISYLFMGDHYKDWLKYEFVRLKDFLTTSVTTKSLVYSHVVLQDGGEIADNVLADMGPEVWEDFQKEFIDTPL
jgi:glycine cleavage system H lipoate-binding protein